MIKIPIIVRLSNLIRKPLFLVSQGFVKEKLSLQSLSLSCVVLDFSGGQVYNKYLGGKDFILDKYERLI